MTSDESGLTQKGGSNDHPGQAYQKKLAMLGLTEFLANVSEACRINRCSRQRFYDVKHAYEEYGIETEHPRYLVVQDTYSVGYLKEVGRIYQQAMFDTYSSVFFAKLKTDRGTEYCGVPERHPYEFFLKYREIEHTKTRTRRPRSNRICELFLKTILNEFCRVMFRKKFFRTIEDFQMNLEVRLEY